MDLDVVLERLLGVEPVGLGLAPVDLQRGAAGLGVLEVLGDNRETVRQLTMAITPVIVFISASFQLSGGAASRSDQPVPDIGGGVMHRRVQRRGVDHAGQLHVDRVLRGAVDLGRNVAARHRLADQPEVLARLELAWSTSGSVAGIVPKAAISP